MELMLLVKLILVRLKLVVKLMRAPRQIKQTEITRHVGLEWKIQRCQSSQVMLENTLLTGLTLSMSWNHMLAIIEQKMCTDDRKVWSRELEKEKKVATLETLMEWMIAEMKSHKGNGAV